MKKKWKFILSSVVLLTLAFSAVATASPNGNQSLDLSYATYQYTANEVKIDRKSTDGILQYENSGTSRSEEVKFHAFVPGGVLEGGSVTVQVYGVGGGQAFSFTVSDIQWHDLYGHYVYEDVAAGIFASVIPGEDGDVIDISKYANESTQSMFSNGVTSTVQQQNGDFALQETSRVAFELIATNNQGDTFQTSGTVGLQLQTPQVQEETQQSGNDTYYTYKYAETYFGEYVGP
jgi:hypothetical protein